MDEPSYLEGRRRAWLTILQECLKQLGVFDDVNDWADNLHLVDIIEKHLVRHIPDPMPRT